MLSLLEKINKNKKLMKTIFKYIMPLVVLLVCISCKKDNQVTQNNQVTKVTQRIIGADDCIRNYGWSWSNGEASTFEVNDDYEFSYLAFKTKVSGELSFSYRVGGWSGDYIEIIVNGKTYFREEQNTYGYWRQTNIGKIKSNEIVFIKGYECRIKDIKIVGLPDNNSDKEDPDNDSQWDF